MVNSNILERVFLIDCGGSLATCFTCEHSGANYLMTAKHVVEGGAPSKFFAGGTWHDLPNTWKCSANSDVAVMQLGSPISKQDPISIGTPASFFFSQRCFFLGFPYGLQVSEIPSSSGTPVPFAKAAIVANTDSNHIFLDGHNNPGFSGGPVFVVNESNHHVTVIGIISGYIPQKSPVKDDSGNDVFLNVNGTAKRVFSQENSGIIKAVQIHEAIAVI